MYEMDETGRRILNELIENSRQSYRSLAKNTKVSIVTIAKRLKQFKKEKIINQFTTRVDYDKLGYDIHVLIMIRVSKGQESEVENRLKSDSNVMAIYDTTGEFDVLVIARLKSRRELDIFIKRMQTYDFVQRTVTALILKTIKDERIKI